MRVIKKSEFTDEGNGRFTKRGHIDPLTDSDLQAAIDEQDQPPAYVATNESAFTVEADPEDSKKWIMVWVAAGTGRVQAKVDVDLDAGETKELSGESEDFKLEEDEATKLNVVLD